MPSRQLRKWHWTTKAILFLHFFVMATTVGMGGVVSTPFLTQHDCSVRGIDPTSTECKENADVRGTVAAKTGQNMLASFLPASLSISFVAVISDRCGRRPAILGFSVGSAIANLSAWFLLASQPGWEHWTLAMCITGVTSCNGGLCKCTAANLDRALL